MNFHFYNRPPSYCDDLDAREPLDEDDDDLDLDDEAAPDDQEDSDAEED